MKIGVECEGFFRGLKTLFVDGEYLPEMVIALANAHECSHIYLGANKARVDAFLPVLPMYEAHKAHLVTLEVSQEDYGIVPRLDNIRVVVRVDVRFMVGPTHLLKIEGERKVGMVMGSQLVMNELNYIDDKEVIIP